jgi:hypothetical protein
LSDVLGKAFALLGWLETGGNKRAKRKKERKKEERGFKSKDNLVAGLSARIAIMAPLKVGPPPRNANMARAIRPGGGGYATEQSIKSGN